MLKNKEYRITTKKFAHVESSKYSKIKNKKNIFWSAISREQSCGYVYKNLLRRQLKISVEKAKVNKKAIHIFY